MLEFFFSLFDVFDLSDTFSALTDGIFDGIDGICDGIDVDQLDTGDSLSDSLSFCGDDSSDASKELVELLKDRQKEQNNYSNLYDRVDREMNLYGEADFHTLNSLKHSQGRIESLDRAIELAQSKRK